MEFPIETRNPISGCLYGCSYCYLDRISKFDKTPKFHPERLADLEKLKEPARIFTGSSGDMMGHWVEAENIQAVIEVMKAHPQHTFQILTKNPKRYKYFEFPRNVWLGTTVDGARNLINISYLRQNKNNLLFVSFEPLLNEVIPDLEDISWVIIGGKSGNPPFYPPKEWIDGIISLAKTKEIPVFIKENAKFGVEMKEFPKEGEKR